ncbi:MAG TPA: fructosamine kinase family protein [Polyangiaceae bacterium]|nr:fructosamine kinase family protein [Polyangiaceae bacterium]
MIGPALRARLESLLGQTLRSVTRVSGGDINDAFELGLADRSCVFLKTNAHAPRGMFAAEAEGLAFLREARALRIPETLAFSTAAEEPAFLLLEFLRSARRRSSFDEELGRGLAALHRFGAPSFGFATPNFIGRLPQENREHSSWAEFYRDQRLAPQVRAAQAAGRVPNALRRKFERLFDRLPELVGEPEAPSRLHGDLWGGNLHVDELGGPCLIDPAVYGGHREMDLAMMQLFGGFSARVFSAYAEAFPLASGHAERVQLYQLYPLLVHLNLFGGGYLHSVERAVSAYV